MRICLLAGGTRGDVQPAVALGRGLRAAGFDVTVCADPGYSGMITAAGLTAEPFDIALTPILHDLAGVGGDEAGGEGWRRRLRVSREAGQKLADTIADHLATVVDRHDVFLSSVITFWPMLPVARATGRPHVTLALAPMTPTRSGAAAGFALRPDADSVLNVAVAKAGFLGAYLGMRPSVRAACARLDLPRHTLRQYLEDVARTPHLLGLSPHVVPRPRDFPEHVVMTGFWTDPLDPGYSPPAQTADFLAAGPPPVYVGFGSMPTDDPEAQFDLVVTALRRAGRRGLVYGTWRDWRPSSPPDDVLVIGETPHEWLFPRTAAVVHQGGAGTLAAAVRAGVPQFVVPHFADQPYWGRRVAQLGLGPPPVRRCHLDGARLASAVARLTEDQGFRDRSAALGAQVRAEDGVAVAVAALDRLLTR